MPSSYVDVRVGEIAGLLGSYPGQFTHTIATAATWERFLAGPVFPGCRAWALKLRQPGLTEFNYAYFAAPAIWGSAGPGAVLNWRTALPDLYVRHAAPGTVFELDVWHELVAAPGVPTIVPPLVPDTGAQGATLNTVITGTNLATIMQVTFSGTLIAVNTLLATATTVTVNITIDGAAALGARDVTVSGLGGSVTAAAAFTVIP